MLPVLTPQEMSDVDAAAPEPVDELIRRAGAAVAREAIDMMRHYGRRVVVVAARATTVTTVARGPTAAGPGRAGARGRRHRRPRRPAPRRPGDRRRLRHGVPGRLRAARPGGCAGAGRRHPQRRRRPDRPGRRRRRPGPPHGDVRGPQAGAAVAPGQLARGRGAAGRHRPRRLRARPGSCVEDVAAWCPNRPVDTHKWRAAVVLVAGCPA